MNIYTCRFQYILSKLEIYDPDVVVYRDLAILHIHRYNVRTRISSFYVSIIESVLNPEIISVIDPPYSKSMYLQNSLIRLTSVLNYDENS